MTASIFTYFLSCSQTDVLESSRCDFVRISRNVEASTEGIKIGSYNQQTVVVKFLQCETVTLTGEDLLELKTVKWCKNLRVIVSTIVNVNVPSKPAVLNLLRLADHLSDFFFILFLFSHLPQIIWDSRTS